jgi:hypothetical protein
MKRTLITLGLLPVILSAWGAGAPTSEAVHAPG